MGFETDRLISVEVLTPGGNWSSYPPHKHDEARPGEAVLEEIYYFEVSGGAPAGQPGPGGYQRVYSTDPARPRSTCSRRCPPATPFSSRTGTMARPWRAPGHDLYFLNVLAGPAHDEPWRSAMTRTHAWIRESWRGEPVDPRLPMTSIEGNGMRLTVAQALVRFLSVQSVERDGEQHRFFAGCFGIFGHGNVAGVGQALLEGGDDLRYYLARNEQAMVHTAVGFARMSDRLRAFACTTSIGPGATNMVTGAAVATTNRIPVLLLPGDVFATRRANPVLQELEDPTSLDVSVNDCLRPVSRYFDRIWRPEQLPPALLHAMRVLTDPAETGAVTLALPEDVQTEAFDVPDDLLVARMWQIRRPPPEAGVARRLGRAGARARSDHSSSPAAASSTAGPPTPCARLPPRPAFPSPRPRPARDRCATTTPPSLGALGATGTPAANELRARRRRRDRDRNEVERLHDRVPLGLPEPRRARSSTSTSRPSTRPSSPAPRSSPTPARRSTRSASDWPGGASTTHYAERVPSDAAALERHRRRSLRPRPPAAAVPERGDRRGRGIDDGPRRRRRGGGEPARATCTSCGALATPRATTSNTPSPAWATRSPRDSA